MERGGSSMGRGAVVMVVEGNEIAEVELAGWVLTYEAGVEEEG